jgi:hypothetical protein
LYNQKTTMNAKLVVFLLFIAAVFANKYGTTPIKYYHPSLHPFKDDQQLKEEAAKDPWGFKNAYKSTIYEMRYYQEHPEVEVPPSFRPETIPVLRNYDIVNDEERTITKVQTNAQVLTGIVDLSVQDSVVKIECPNEKTLIITTKDDQAVKEWAPGTRFIIPETHKCIAKQDRPFFRLAIRRTLDKSTGYYTTKYETEDLDMHELLMDAEVEVKRTPMPQKSPNPFALKFGLFSFNYDWKNERCLQPNLPIYNDKYINLVCAECYAYVEAEVDVKLSLSWRLGIKYFKASIVGFTKLVYDIFGEATFTYSKEFEKALFKGVNAYRIAFSIGPVPVWIDFDFSLLFKGKFDFSAAAQLQLGGNFWDKLTLGMEYDSKRPKNDRFRFIKANEHSDIKDLIPKVKFDTQLHVTTVFSLIPEVEIKLYSVAGVKLGFVPYIDGEAEAELDLPKIYGKCPKNELYWNVGWGLNAYMQMMKLKVWKFETDLGGLLPMPKDHKEWEIVKRKVITTGCFPIPLP